MKWALICNRSVCVATTISWPGISSANFNAIYNLERLELRDLEQRNVASFAQICHHFFSNEENMKELFLVQPFTVLPVSVCHR